MDTRDTALDSGHALPEERRTDGQKAMIRAAVMSGIMNATVYGSVNTLFLLNLGAGAIHIAVVTTIDSLSSVGQLLGLHLIAKTGKVRLGVATRLLDLAPISVLFAIAIVGRGGPIAIWATVAATGTLSLIHVVGNTGWWPLLQDNTSGAPIGDFLARMRTRLRFVEVGVPLLVGAYLGAQPACSRFAALFAVAMLAMVLGARFMSGVPERAAANAAKGLLASLREAMAVPSVRRYVAFVVTRDFTIGLAWSFWVVLWKARGMPASHIVWLTVVAAVGNVIALRTWGKIADRYGSRPVLSSTLLAEAALGLGWFFMPTTGTSLLLWAVAFNLVWGFLQGGFLMGRTHAMMKAVPTACQVYGFTLISLASGLAAATGALGGGSIFEWLPRALPRLWGTDTRVVYFAAVHASFVGVWLMSRRLSGYEQQTPTRRLMLMLWDRLTTGWRDAVSE
jgi:hypothetical protein